ncbi:adenylyltransferase/cytidyltransferase family protein [Butyrivibrio sp. INlla14]|uniref:adenylyltransferase/cytidyltransferase family protein n=1 Tax=Butyrivibrio sp. INlla14 TaxID=1520808 RepID=UPI00087736D1|nr:adenylyltransferase/cytidyltransferase family protein [Butyrivibrio sp. INlla14]SCY74446.1 glycerol-3-phosphate cytidylyltransferase [Butyrivibrio sp. INlla14]
MKKVITYGTFDLFHQGHFNILKRAKELGDYLIVGVTSESFDIERGKLNVKDSLLKRIENVDKTGFADEIIIEEYQGQKVNDIIKHKADVFVVGSDWTGKFDYLKQYCEVVYLERTKDISSTAIREKNISRIGIVAGRGDDGGFILESQYVSGLHVEAVYSEDVNVADDFCQKYELNKACYSYKEFLDSIDIVYIRFSGEKKYEYALGALKQKKYVIVDNYAYNSPEQIEEMQQCAKENGVVICENIITAYLRAFHQMLWMVHSNCVGRIASLGIKMSSIDFSSRTRFEDMLIYALFVSLKIYGDKLINASINTSYICDADRKHYGIILNGDGVFADIDIGIGVEMDSGLRINGFDGIVVVENDWWNMGFFQINCRDKYPKRYSFNFDGNGTRYMLQELMIMIESKTDESTRVFYKESKLLAELVGRVKESIKA